MKLFGLIGYPVKHSYSALMHNAAFKELGIDARYELFEIKPETLADDFKALVEQGVCGFNVTIPHKEKITICLDQLDQDAALIGAVNTIKVNQDTTVTGYNTDGVGFITHLVEVVGFNPTGKRVSILGAGGAAKAVSMQLAKSGVRSICLFDIESDKAKTLVAKLKENFSNCDLRLASEANALFEERPDLLVNATPIGMHQEDELVVDPAQLHAKLVVYDLIYNPAETPLLAQAKRKGCAGIFNGLGMLLYQGAMAFKIWLEVEPPIEVMEQGLRKMLNHDTINSA